MKKITDITVGIILVRVVSFTFAQGPVLGRAAEHSRFFSKPEHVEERPSSGPETFVGKPSLVIPVTSGSVILWSSPIPRS